MDTRLTAAQAITLRTKLAMTQQEFSAELGISVSTIRRWEQGKAEPPIWLADWFVGFTANLRSLDTLQPPAASGLTFDQLYKS